MNFAAKSTNIEQCKSDCVVIGVHSHKKLSDRAQQFDQISHVSLKELFQSKTLSGKAGQILELHQPYKTAKTAIIVGFGDSDTISAEDFRLAIKSAATAIKKRAYKTISFFIDDMTVDNWSESQKAQYCAEQLTYASYTFTQCKNHTAPLASPLTRSKILYHSAKNTQTKTGLTVGTAIGNGINVARELGNLPGNICTPSYLAKQARSLARSHKKITSKVLSEKQMQELGMGSLLSVSAGSAEPAQLIIMEYKGAAKSQKPHVLVGKGITFDTGGISLKPGAAMDEMKFDMCGAASVFGTMNTIAQLEPAINIVAIVAAAENMPGSKATKPGDIVTSMSGKTIEILNTDAEGRLVLCDALSYAERYKPQSVIDIATLTGACVIALGSHATGLFSNNDELTKELLDAGNATGDRAWPMPIWDDYKKQLKSNFADLANIGGREAGSITAACFLSHFTQSYPWAHLDIAGTAWLSGTNKGATGRPVSLLTHYLLSKTQ